MSVKTITSKQYQDKVNTTATKLRKVDTPPEGWLRTVRKALGMSVAQLARRLRVTRAHVNKTEKGELSGSMTIKTLQNMAEAMGCRLVYAVVPEHDVEKILAARAKKKAMKIVEEATKHMALEEQALSEKQMAFEVERLQKEMLKDLPANFWNNED